jgi:hypothetical protein
VCPLDKALFGKIVQISPDREDADTEPLAQILDLHNLVLRNQTEDLTLSIGGNHSHNRLLSKFFLNFFEL